MGRPRVLRPQLRRDSLGGNLPPMARMRFLTFVILGVGVASELLLYLNPPTRPGSVGEYVVQTGRFVAYALLIALLTLVALIVETWLHERRRRSRLR